MADPGQSGGAPLVIPSITGGQVERLAPGDRFTLALASGEKVAGGQLVELTGDFECQEAGDESEVCVGVALHDADADGEFKKVSVAAEGVWNLKDSGSGVSAGETVVCAASGEIKALDGDDFNQAVGIALADIGAGATGPVKLRL